MKKFVSILLAAGMAASLLTACGSSDSTASSTGSTAESESTASTDGEAETITFWYNNSGDEALVYEEAIAAYNASQSKYKVEGLSVTDSQKLLVAMSSNEAPDVVKTSNSSVIQYQLNGLLENLQTYIDEEGYDTSIFSEQSIEANTLDGSIYALPLDAYTIQMFYNKDLLEEAGYSEPPATMEEMYEMAVAATKLDDSGNIEVLGYPLFPYASARQELVYGFGGRWWSEDSKPTPDDEGILASLEMNVKFRNEFGGGALDSFVATANTNRYTEQDMFFTGKQLFRLDGSWLPTMMENYGSTVNWGIALIPGTEANPDLQGTARYETDSVFVPAMAQHKDGAWDFVKYLCGGDGAKIIDVGTGNLPALTALYDDADILAKPGFAEFIDALKLGKGIQYPQMKDFDEYISMINATLDTVYAGTATPSEALASLKEQSAGLS